MYSATAERYLLIKVGYITMANSNTTRVHDFFRGIDKIYKNVIYGTNEKAIIQYLYLLKSNSTIGK